MLLSNGFYASSGIATTENGFYRIEENKQLASGAEIYYYDFATQKKAALSSYINSQKSNIIDYTMGGIWAMSDSTNLYLYKRGNYWLSGNGNNADGFATFTKTTLAGENKQQIQLSSYEEPVLSSGIVSDGKNLYFISTDLNKDNIQSATLNLKSVDFENRKSNILKELSIKENYKIVDVFGNNIVIVAHLFDKKSDSLETRQAIKQQILYYNVDTQQLTTVFEFDPKVMNGIYYKNAFYFYNHGNTKIEKIDLSTDTKTVLVAIYL